MYELLPGPKDDEPRFVSVISPTYKLSEDSTSKRCGHVFYTRLNLIIIKFNKPFFRVEKVVIVINSRLRLICEHAHKLFSCCYNQFFFCVSFGRTYFFCCCCCISLPFLSLIFIIGFMPLLTTLCKQF